MLSTYGVTGVKPEVCQAGTVAGAKTAQPPSILGDFAAATGAPKGNNFLRRAMLTYSRDIRALISERDSSMSGATVWRQLWTRHWTSQHSFRVYWNPGDAPLAYNKR